MSPPAEFDLEFLHKFCLVMSAVTQEEFEKVSVEEFKPSTTEESQLYARFKLYHLIRTAILAWYEAKDLFSKGVTTEEYLAKVSKYSIIMPKTDKDG